MIPVLTKRLKSNKVFFLLISCLLLSIVGCTNSFDKEEKSIEEKVHFSIVYSDESPVKDFSVTLARTGESAHQIGMILDPTDEDGKTEATLTIGATYEAYLVIDDDTTQYEEFTVSENVEDNAFTFMLNN